MKTRSKVWTALVEAKVGNSDLTPEQLESYLDLSRLNGIDALITLSNKFACLPTHHPVALPAATRRKAAIEALEDQAETVAEEREPIG